MRILHVNFSDCGGAGNAARRSHLALLSAGINSKLLVAKKLTSDPEIYVLKYSQLRKLWRLVQLKYDQLLKRKIEVSDKNLRSSNRLPGFALKEIERFQPDIVHLHWISAGMLSVSEIQRIQCPVVWTFHDLWPVTGSWHCAGTLMTAEMAQQYPKGIESWDTTDYGEKIGAANRRSFQDKPEGVVTLCRNFYNVVKEAQWLPNRYLEIIPNCINPERFFSVENKTESRAENKLPHDKVLLLYCAASLNARHKGMDLLLESLELLDDEFSENCALVVVGGESELKDVAGIPCYSMGIVSDEKRIASIYQSCDVFLCPSREDNFPNTVAEASSCGLPSVAFRTGGLPDMIEHKITGYLAEAFSVKEYATGIKMTIDNHEAWRPAVIEKAQATYSPKQHVMEMLALYHKMLEKT